MLRNITRQYDGNWIIKTISQQNWKDLVANIKPSLIAQILSFEECLNIVYKMLYNEQWEEDWQVFATQILQSIRQLNQHRWESDWRYDAFLGTACDIILDYDERYNSYQRAYNAAEQPPAELGFALARCTIAPGKSYISETEAISILEESLSKKPFIEGVEFLVNLYNKLTNTTSRKNYWKNILEELKKANVHACPINPPEIQID